MAVMTIANKCASKGLKVEITDEVPYGGKAQNIKKENLYIF
jgi:hypothetical protein